MLFSAAHIKSEEHRAIAVRIACATLADAYGWNLSEAEHRVANDMKENQQDGKYLTLQRSDAI